MTTPLILFSAGIESTVLLAHALDAGLRPQLLEITTPQRPAGERMASIRIRRHYRLGAPHRISMPAALTATSNPKSPQGYIPYRNLWLHASAAVLSRRIGAHAIWAGHTRKDAEDFPDASAAHFKHLQATLDAGRLPKEPRLEIQLPFHDWSKRQVVEHGRRLNAPLNLTWSCYRDGQRHCGRCTSCQERMAALGD
jgi:7-cyano-7-deazaguanine synthase in queuosine biosynthesis